MSPISPDRLVVPAAHVLGLRRQLAKYAGPAAAVFDDVDRELLSAGEDGIVPLRLDGQLCARAEELGAPAHLGYVAGCAVRAAEHGVLGYALMSCPTLGDALALWTRFAPALAGGYEIRPAAVPEGLELLIRDPYPWLPGRTLGLDRFVAFTFRLAERLAGVPGGALKLHLPPRALARAAAAREHVLATLPALSPDPALIRLIVPSACLAVPIATSQPAVLGLLVQQCELEHARARRSGDWASRVERLLERRLEVPLPIEAAAKALCVSTRTLKRRLQEEGWSYRAIVDEARKREALRAMANPALRIEDIACRVGYTDQANFARAFRRWTGKAPGVYRAQTIHVTPSRQTCRAATTRRMRASPRVA
jgi:AraC-like DNA-binding protein